MDVQAIVELKIQELSGAFYKDPDEFFNEQDFLHRFYCMMLPEFKNLIHPEYPTRKRFIIDKSDDKEYSFGVHAFNPDDPHLRKESRRGHYDFVIFNDKFYNKHNDMLEQFDCLSNNNVDINLDINNQYIDFVFSIVHY